MTCDTIDDHLVFRASFGSNEEGEVVVRRGRSASELSRFALYVRRIWMDEMGLSQEEIDEHCDPTTATAVLAEELESLDAALKLREMRRGP